VKNVSDLDPGPLKRLMASHPAPAERLAFTADWAMAHDTEPKADLASGASPES
jgi:hypothetical protein